MVYDMFIYITINCKSFLYIFLYGVHYFFRWNSHIPSVNIIIVIINIIISLVLFAKILIITVIMLTNIIIMEGNHSNIYLIHCGYLIVCSYLVFIIVYLEKKIWCISFTQKLDLLLYIV